MNKLEALAGVLGCLRFGVGGWLVLENPFLDAHVWFLPRKLLGSPKP